MKKTLNFTILSTVLFLNPALFASSLQDLDPSPEISAKPALEHFQLTYDDHSASRILDALTTLKNSGMPNPNADKVYESIGGNKAIDINSRFQAIDLLGQMGAEYKSAAARLYQSIGEDKAIRIDRRLEAINRSTLMGADKSDTMRIYQSIGEDETIPADSRLKAMNRLRQMGENSVPVGTCQSIAKDSKFHIQTRIYAFSILKMIERDTKSVHAEETLFIEIAQLALTSSETNTTQKFTFAKLLVKKGEQYKALIAQTYQDIAQNLQETLSVRLEAIDKLKQMGAEYKTIEAGIYQDIAQNSQELIHVRLEAIDKLAQMGGEYKSLAVGSCHHIINHGIGQLNKLKAVDKLRQMGEDYEKLAYDTYTAITLPILAENVPPHEHLMNLIFEATKILSKMGGTCKSTATQTYLSISKLKFWSSESKLKAGDCLNDMGEEYQDSAVEIYQSIIGDDFSTLTGAIKDFDCRLKALYRLSKISNEHKNLVHGIYLSLAKQSTIPGSDRLKVIDKLDEMGVDDASLNIMKDVCQSIQESTNTDPYSKLIASNTFDKITEKHKHTHTLHEVDAADTLINMPSLKKPKNNEAAAADILTNMLKGG